MENVKDLTEGQDPKLEAKDVTMQAKSAPKEATNVEVPDRVSISVTLLNELIGVLATMPYKSVANVIDAVHRDVRGV